MKTKIGDSGTGDNGAGVVRACPPNDDARDQLVRVLLLAMDSLEQTHNARNAASRNVFHESTRGWLAVALWLLGAEVAG